MKGHRKTVKRTHEPSDCQELTFSCYRRMPLPTNDDRRLLLAEKLETAIGTQSCKLMAQDFKPGHAQPARLTNNSRYRRRGIRPGTENTAFETNQEAVGACEFTTPRDVYRPRTPGKNPFFAFGGTRELRPQSPIRESRPTSHRPHLRRPSLSRPLRKGNRSEMVECPSLPPQSPRTQSTERPRPARGLNRDLHD